MEKKFRSDIQGRLSDILDSNTILFPIVIRKIMFATMMKTKTGSTDTEIRVLGGLTTGQMKTSEISRIFQISKPNVTTMVDKLADNGYVQRLHDDKDRRVVIISITDKGKKLIAKRRRIMKRYIINVFAKWDDAEIDETVKALEIFHGILTKLDRSI
ncbi:MAG: MarR family transcriptional regulator [Dehalococcoidia bacterium]|nr:MarR family transcriptional regulator [Dehalococcoidia bacterium]